MVRKLRQGTAASSVTVFTSICASLALTRLVIILKTSYNSCVGIPTVTRCSPKDKERRSLALLQLGPWEMQEFRAQGTTLWAEGMLYSCVTVIAARDKNFKVENSKL